MFLTVFPKFSFNFKIFYKKDIYGKVLNPCCNLKKSDANL